MPPSQPDEAPATPKPPISEASKALRARVEELRKRYDEIEEIFTGFPVRPTSSKNFRAFLEEHVNDLASTYVVLGTFDFKKIEKEAAEDLEEAKREEGFAIGGTATKAVASAGIDPALLKSPAALAALAGGVDLLNDKYDE
jgi:hypothetical protein